MIIYYNDNDGNNDIDYDKQLITIMMMVTIMIMIMWRILIVTTKMVLILITMMLHKLDYFYQNPHIAVLHFWLLKPFTLQPECFRRKDAITSVIYGNSFKTTI